MHDQFISPLRCYSQLIIISKLGLHMTGKSNASRKRPYQNTYHIIKSYIFSFISILEDELFDFLIRHSIRLIPSHKLYTGQLNAFKFNKHETYILFLSPGKPCEMRITIREINFNRALLAFYFNDYMYTQSYLPTLLSWFFTRTTNLVFLITLCKNSSTRSVMSFTFKSV